MSIIILLLVFFIFSNASFVSDNSLNSHYLDKKQTATINGIFVFLVFLSHGKQYMQLSGPYHSTYLFISGFLNQAVVVTFLFYSGYGIMEGIKRKSLPYVNTFPSKMLKLLLQFDIAVLLYLITDWLLGKYPTPKEILLALTTWTSIGNSNWYITAMIILYFLTFFSFRVSNNNFVSLLILTILTIITVYIFMKIGRPSYTYNTMICYPFGIFYSLYHEKFEKILKNSLFYLLAFLVTLIISVYVRSDMYNNIKFYSIWMICFMIFILLISMKVNLNSPLLHYFGNHVFSIYILQRLPMMVLAYFNLNKHIFTFITISFVSTLILATIFDKYLLPHISHFVNRVIKKIVSY